MQANSATLSELTPRAQLWLTLRSALRVAPALSLEQADASQSSSTPAASKPRTVAALRRARFGDCYEALLGGLILLTLPAELVASAQGDLARRHVAELTRRAARSPRRTKTAATRLTLSNATIALLEAVINGDGLAGKEVGAICAAALNDVFSGLDTIHGKAEFENAFERDQRLALGTRLQADGLFELCPPLWTDYPPKLLMPAIEALGRFLAAELPMLQPVHAAMLQGDANTFAERAQRWLEWHGTPTPADDEQAEAELEAPAQEERFALAALGDTASESIATQDRLGRERLTEALATLLKRRESTAPLCIGLFGHWGSGKSSQIELLRQALPRMQGPAIRVAVFNAWSHEKADKLGAALAQSVVEGLLVKSGYFAEIWFALKLSVRRRSQRLRALGQAAQRAAGLRKAWLQAQRGVEASRLWLGETIPLAVGAVLPLGVAVWIAHQIYLGGPKADMTSLEGAGRAMAAVGSTILGLIAIRKFVADNLTDWFKRFNLGEQLGRLRLPDFSTHLGLHHEIQRNLEHLCALALRGTDAQPDQGDYLLLVVDDLDRCSPATVKEMFDAVRLVAHIPRVVVVVAIDERIAFTAVTQYFEGFGHAGREPALVARDYLAKVFQLSVTLPAVEEEHIRQYIEQKLFTDVLEEPRPTQDDAEDEVLAVAGGQVAAPDTDAGQASLVDDGHRQSPEISAGEVRHDAALVETLTPQPGTRRQERDAFTELALVCQITNPRLLGRMAQTWRLLKHLVLEDGYSAAEAQPWLALLFWREWLFQQTAGLRAQCQAWPLTARNGVPPEALQVLAQIPALQEMQAEPYGQMCGVVDKVLLPFAPPREAAAA